MQQEIIGKRIDVLGKGFVELVDFMPHPATEISGDLAIVNAARVSFIGESKGEEKDKKLLFYLFKHKHTSPFEQVEFKFRIKAPLMTWWQLVRHRTFSLNLQSLRYMDADEDEFYVPTEWRKQSSSNKQASDGVFNKDDSESFSDTFRKIAEIGYNSYKSAISNGMAREQARLFLPAFAYYYTGIVKVDAHNLMHFLRLRMSNEAQYEIRVYAETIYENFFKLALPWTAEAFELEISKIDDALWEETAARNKE